MKIAGIDIGGANLKFVLINPETASASQAIDGLTLADIEIADEFAFPVWNSHSNLVAKLSEIRGILGPVDGVAVTMTAELADCFGNKREGVHFIVDAVESAFPKTVCRFYTTTGQLLTADLAKQNWSLTAASNWHASAWYLFRQHQLPDGFLFDIGSTTCDIIPVQGGLPTNPGQTDFDRLRNGQLVYAGIGRTPICSLIDSVRLTGSDVAVARELFATVIDAMIWTGRSSPQPNNHNSADQRPLSRSACRTRLCRMVCADDCDLPDQQVSAIAEQTYSVLQQRIVASLQTVVANHPAVAKTFCLAGSGQAVARSAIQMACGDDPELEIITTHLPEAMPGISPLAGQQKIGQAIPAMAVAAKWLASAEAKP